MGKMAFAEQIRRQLGTRAMTLMRVSDFEATSSGVAFRIGGSGRCHAISVCPEKDGTYSVMFLRDSGLVTAMYTVGCVRPELLKPVIEEGTGLLVTI